MNKIQQFRAQIIGLNHDGRGIAKVDGKVTFITGALPSETVIASYTKRHSKYDEAQVMEVLSPTTKRTTPICSYFDVCGGCSLQHLEEQAQLALKQQTLLEQLEHFGKIKPEAILSPLLSPISHYRQKARLAVKYVHKKSKVLVGFHEKNGRYVADIEKCVILDEKISDLLKLLQQLISQLSNYQQIPQIEIAVGDNASALIFRHLQEFNDDDIEKLKKFGEDHNMQIYLQPKNIASIHCIYPKKPVDLCYTLSEHSIKINFRPFDFTQINPFINQQMINLAIKLLEPKPSDEILDLFCGIGNFTLPLARYSGHVTGIEGNEEAVKQARANAKSNKISNVDFYCFDLTADIPEAFMQARKFNKILLDPPRSGAIEIINYLLQKISVDKIVYISCNPATFARDAGELSKYGYYLAEVGIMDMFPHTKHVETIGFFVKK